MKRRTFAPRPGWQARLEAVGMLWHGAVPEHPVPYWAEDAGYSFTRTEITALEGASQHLTDCVLAATEYAMTHGRLAELGIPNFMEEAVRESWERDDPSVYLRLDLAYRPGEAPQLLEVNGQTPTSLLEAAVCQWQWLEDRQAAGELPATSGQWNTIHEALGEQWAHLQAARGLQEVTFSSAPIDEDLATVTYLRELANAAGIHSTFLEVDALGLAPGEPYLLDGWPRPIRQLMWLWPFEFAWDARDGEALARTQTRFIEPLWKAVTSSKGLLALLHELYPDDPHILPASLTPGTLQGPAVQKPLYSREGQNVILPGAAMTPGDYAGYPLMEQAYTELPTFTAPDGPRYPVLGVWAAGSEVCGLGIREGRGRVTDNRASFAPHWVED
ncbi:glutathionylspermidine synthase [Deinococcus proteolyticus MRP]|uniref:Glutathionylspermidine synthase n=1 Tax=Deinococcus proteolyticus (strain ATCC 35074 / DSM 20540 / JCM 6276 / NBRC 101906 / NCIMB 13154 / VKM Ac-1939 / CCM 2703 / MRP) TaxID=693977 RepID=F0RNV3_DEIPM|nr:MULTISPECIES: glutathionylspermidine synthase family protein [Deinococcus]ADY26362.1 glutathionylspermidine synthase [Deinococcus proteolyticus MRP]MCY1702481.1 glutathionylspermidine synthase family protein [Deinococcus sp. SL84]